jgi:hypothetical protein
MTDYLTEVLDAARDVAITNRNAQRANLNFKSINRRLLEHSKTLAAVAPIITNNTIPSNPTSVSGTNAGLIVDNVLYDSVTTQYTAPVPLDSFAGVFLVAKNYNGSATLVKVGEDTFHGAAGTVQNFKTILQRTGEVVTFFVVPKTATEVTPIDWTTCPSFTLTLDGVATAPPAPSINQSLIGTPLGYQFSFNELSGALTSVIQTYRIYRNTTNNSGTATLLLTVPHDPKQSGAIVVNDTIVPATGTAYFYWVSAVNTSGLESSLTAAQSGPVAGAVGSVPPSLSTAFSYTATGTSPSITWAWAAQQAIFRADGSITNIGAGTQAITGLAVSSTYYFYPYWRESDQTIQWLTPSDITIPNLVGVTLNGTTQFIQTTTGSFHSDNSAGQYSLELWMKTSAVTVQGLMSFSAPQGSGAKTGLDVQLLMESTGELRFTYVNASVVIKNVLTSGAGINDGTWHHIVVTFATGGTVTIYVDGTSKGSGATLGGPRTLGVNCWWHIGFAHGDATWPNTVTSAFFNGTLSHVAYYTTALSSTQVTTHVQTMTNFGQTLYDSVVAADTAIYYWKLIDTSGTTAVDSAGTNTGTYQNTPTLNQSSAAISVIGTPQIAWPFQTFLASQGQNLKNRVPLSSGAMSAATPAAGITGGGSGGGSGGGGSHGGCFSSNTRVKTWRGDIPIAEVVVGDLVLTAAGTWRPVVRVLEHEPCERTMCDMGAGELITLPHSVLAIDSWVPASELFDSRVSYEQVVFNLSISARTLNALSPKTENSFTLTNGRVVHNVLK